MDNITVPAVGGLKCASSTDPPVPVGPFGRTPNALWCLLGGVCTGRVWKGDPGEQKSVNHSCNDWLLNAHGCLGEHPWVSRPSAEKSDGESLTCQQHLAGKRFQSFFSHTQSWNKWSDLFLKIYHPNKEVHPFLKSWKGSKRDPRSLNTCTVCSMSAAAKKKQSKKKTKPKRTH